MISFELRCLRKAGTLLRAGSASAYAGDDSGPIKVEIIDFEVEEGYVMT